MLAALCTGDIYVFCFYRTTGTVLAGPPTTRGRDVRTITDPTGKAFGQQMFANVRDDQVIVIDYLFPKPKSTVPVPKESFVEGLGDVACGVGYYIAATETPEGSSRAAREDHACGVVMGLQRGVLYDICMRSLDASLSQQDKAELLSRRVNECAQLGLTTGTPSFAACVANGPGL
jgi:Cache domain